jgi:hypothetical protein
VAKPRLVIKTDVGTFTRQTSNPYTHVVVVGPVRASWAEAERLASIDYWTRQAAWITLDLADPSRRDRYQTVEGLQSNLAHAQASLAALPTTPITTDQGAPAAYSYHRRLRLAQLQADKVSLERFTWVRVYAVDGTRDDSRSRLSTREGL